MRNTFAHLINPGVGIGLLVGIAWCCAMWYWNSHRAPKPPPQGRALLNDARAIDAATDQWVLENGEFNGESPLDVDRDGTNDVKIVRARETPTRESHYIICNSEWVEVQNLDFFRGRAIRPNQFGYVVARASSEGGKEITHEFVNGKWIKVSEQRRNILDSPPPPRPTSEWDKY